MIKIKENVVAWEFSVRLTAADGAKIERIEVDCLGRESEELK